MSEPPITLRAVHDSGPGNTPPSRVVIHATCPGTGYPTASGPGTALGTARYFQMAGAGGSAHYVCDGDDEQHCVPDDVIGWHAPPNPHSIGIEICSEGGAYAKSYTREQWLSAAVWPGVLRAAARTRELCQRYGLPMVKLSSADLLAGRRGICFTGDTLVLTRRGLVPIPEVVVADEVWTHRSRWRRVKSVMRRRAPVLTLAGQGHPGLRVTAEHPIYSPPCSRPIPSDRARNGGGRRYADPEWVPAEGMLGRYWMSPRVDPEARREPPAVVGSAWSKPVAISPELLYVVGRWVGDGSLEEGRRLHISTPPHQVDELIDRCWAAGLYAQLSCPPAARAAGNVGAVRIASVPLARWLVDHFGQHSHGKHLPGWLFEVHPKYREAFMRGYLAADGYALTSARHAHEYPRHEASTVSKALAFGIKLLAQSIGWGTAVYLERRAGTQIIQGRRVAVRDRWRVRMTEGKPTRARFDWAFGHLVGRVRAITPELGEQDVYNISVDEDESYVADGVVVHNCGHVDVSLAYAQSTHTDPGPAFPWAEFLIAVNQSQGTDVQLSDRLPDLYTGKADDTLSVGDTWAWGTAHAARAVDRATEARDAARATGLALAAARGDIADLKERMTALGAAIDALAAKVSPPVP